MESENKLVGVTVLDAGHSYELHNLESGVQTLNFIKKEKGEEGEELKTVQDGTTNEIVLRVLIDRLGVLNTKLPDAHTEKAIALITEALAELEARTADRKERGVEGTHQA